MGNDPLNKTDPTGECPSCIGAVSSVLLGAAIRAATGGEIFDPKAIAIDAVSGLAGAGLLNKAGKLVQLARIPRSGIGRSAAFGRIGEKAAGISGQKTVVTIAGRTRVPDQITAEAVKEVKNVAAISSREAAQIADSAAFAQGTGREAILMVRPGTDVSKVQGLIDSGAVTRTTIPGIGSDGLRQAGAAASAAAGAAAGTATNCVRDRAPCN